MDNYFHVTPKCMLSSSKKGQEMWLKCPMNIDQQLKYSADGM